jgi:hypothetical protein
MSGTFQGVGTLQFSPDNKHAQIFSGSVSANNIETTLLEYSNNSEYHMAQVLFNVISNTTSDMDFKLYLNDVNILDMGLSSFREQWYYPIPIMIPPFSTIKITCRNNSSSDAEDVAASVISNVHGAIEQFSLEVKE